MRIYLAGNFCQMRSVEKEYAACRKGLEHGDYRRLASFFYANAGMSGDWTDNVMVAVDRIKAEEVERTKDGDK